MEAAIALTDERNAEITTKILAKLTEIQVNETVASEEEEEIESIDVESFESEDTSENSFDDFTVLEEVQKRKIHEIMSNIAATRELITREIEAKNLLTRIEKRIKELSEKEKQYKNENLRLKAQLRRGTKGLFK